MIAYRSWRAALCGAAVACIALSAFRTLSAADATAVRAAVEPILEAGWNPAPEAYAQVAKHYDAARNLARDDGRIDYALFLAQLKHRKYREAQETVERLLGDHPDHWGAWQGRIYLAVLTRRTTAALVDMEQAARNMPAAEGQGDEERPLAEMSQFLGRVFAYLGGPAANAVPADVLAGYQERVAAKLTTNRREAFTQGLHAVRERFAALQLERMESRTEAKEQQEQANAQDRERLAAEKDSVAQQKRSVDEQAAAARATAETTLREIGRRAAPLENRLAQLNAQAVALQTELAATDAQIAQLEQLALDAPDPILRRQHLAAAALLGTTQIGRQGALAAVSNEAAQVNSGLVGLENERRSATAAYQAEMKRLGRTAEQLHTTTRRIAAEERVASKPATGATAGVHALGASATALTTYQPFPFDRERQRLLDSLR